MNNNLLSPIHIQKLGHPIEEIRSRALHSIWSKYNLELVDETNLENTKLLLEKLIDWFSFETHPHEEKVLKLIIKILGEKHFKYFTKEVNCREILSKFDKVQRCVEDKFFPLIEEIFTFLTQPEENEQKNNSKVDTYKKYCSCNILAEQKSLSDDQAPIHQTLQTLNEYEKVEKLNALKGNECYQSSNFTNPKITSKSECAIKIDYFPWQYLVFSDSHVLTSVYDEMRYIDNANSVLKACQCYVDILLTNFPTEVFIQRTLLVQTLFELMHLKDKYVFKSAVNCLIATVEHLFNQFKFALDISLIHFKNSPNYFNVSNGDGNNSEENEMQRLVDVQHSLNSEDIEFEREGKLMEMKSHQYSVAQFCFSVLYRTIPQLTINRSAEESNLVFELILKTFNLLAYNIIPVIWCSKHRMKDDLYKLFSLFYEPLKFHKTKFQVTHSIIVHIIVKMLHVLKPTMKELQEILPHCIQLELVECASNYVYILLFPKLKCDILSFMDKFLGQRKNEILEEYKTSLELCNSMKSAVQFLKRYKKLKTKPIALRNAHKGLLCLEFHRNFEFVEKFVKNCLFKWSEQRLQPDEIALQKTILLQLLSHGDEEIKGTMYKVLHSNVIKLLGVDVLEKQDNQNPGNQFDFLFDSDVLTEIFCHGLNSPETQIQNISSEIMVHLLKGKIFFSDSYWKIFMKALIPCLPLLQCFADKSTPLGICVFKMLDPDISRTISLPPLDLLRGNLRFLFSKNHLIREEALLRLLWLLSKEDPEKKKLPRLNLLRGINLSSICSSVVPDDYCRLKQSFYSTDSLCNVIEMLCAENIEPSVRRSALSQLNVMLEDCHLHSTFLEQNGLNIIFDIFKNCLVEKAFQNYPDSVVPIMNILKLLSLYNPSIRSELSLDIDLYYCILRGLLLFNSERHSRQHGVELLCLLLFNECIINVSKDKVVSFNISIPEVVVDKLCLPFVTQVHWKSSKHTEPIVRESVMLKENSARLLRVYWNIEWFGSISQVLALNNEDLKKNIFSPFLPKDMLLKPEDLKLLKECSVGFGIQKMLFDVQNATTHESVITAINELNRYLLLYELETTLDEPDISENSKEMSTSILQLPWEDTFGKFFLSIPSCEDDEALLFQVVRIIRLVLKALKSEKLYVWIEKLLTDELETLPNVLKSFGKSGSSFARRDVVRAVTGLAKDVVTRNTELLTINWLFYIDIIIAQLNPKQDFCNLSHIDWLMSLLVDITGIRFHIFSSEMNQKNIVYMIILDMALNCREVTSPGIHKDDCEIPVIILSKTNILVVKIKINLAGRSTKNVINRENLYKELITRVMEILVALHCTKDSQDSFLGINIIKNCLFVLNHILADTQTNIKDWERLWYQSLSEVTGHTEQTNYCWLLSLWFVRDPIIRALAVQLLTGFTLTSNACEILIESLQIEFEYLWNEGFKLLLDDLECHLVREKAALLLSNLTHHGSVTTASGFLQNLRNIFFYETLLDLIERMQLEPVDESDFAIVEHYSRHGEEDYVGNKTAKSTMSLISAINTLLINIMFLNPEEVAQTLVQIGILEGLTKLFDSVDEICHKSMKEEFVVDLLKMHASSCKVIAKCMASCFAGYCYIQQLQHFISSLYCLMNFNLFDCSSESILDQRNRLWCGVLDIFSLLLTGFKETENVKESQIEGFKALNNAMSENGTDYFISSIYLSVSSNFCELRFRSLAFLANLLSLEAFKIKECSLVDIFQRNIFSESATQASIFCFKGFSIEKRMDLNFEKRLCDVLLQAFNLGSHYGMLESKSPVPDALGCLLIVSERAQNFCIDNGLADNILEGLRTAFVKLSMERVDCLKKVAERKRIDPILNQIETLCRLLNNLLTSSGKAKSYVAGTGLSSLIHKLWHWCCARSSLSNTVLKLLCTFTLDSEAACRSMATDKSWNMIGLSKPQGSTTLISTIMAHMEREMENTMKNDCYSSLELSFQLLENCSRVTECRSLIVKGPLLACFENYCRKLSKKGIHCSHIIELWYNFFTIFTSYQEGQTAILKNQSALEAIIFTTSANSHHRRKALIVLRNISFHQLNRIQLLSNYQFLSAMIDVLKSGSTEEICLVLYAIWGLTLNWQKGKIIVRNAGFEEALKETKNRIMVSGDCSALVIIDNVIKILENK